MSTSPCWAIGPQGYGVYRLTRATGELSRSSGDPENYLVPGFVDIHIHGAFGIDFISADSSEILTLCRRLREVGYELFLPTTVTQSFEQVMRAVKQLPEDPMIAGFHLEGPFISAKHPGAQPPSSIMDPPDGPSPWDEIWDHPKLRVVTLAPELPRALNLIRRLSERGVISSMGHTDAKFDQCKDAVEAGLSHATHTFNAMRGLHHREPGGAGAALAIDEISAELIYDRVHVSTAAAKVLVRSKPSNRLIAVSDSTMASGLSPGTDIEMWGLKCVVGDHQVRLASNGALAGSGITLLDAFRNLLIDFGPEVAIRACSINPRLALGMTSPPKFWNIFDSQLNIVEQISIT